MKKPIFSIIAPIYNELKNIPELYPRVRDVMDQTSENWELILVDDGSTDGSTDLIRELASRDERVRPVIFALFWSPDCGHSGLDYSRRCRCDH